jgi:hypothetical protein
MHGIDDVRDARLLEPLERGGERGRIVRSREAMGGERAQRDVRIAQQLDEDPRLEDPPRAAVTTADPGRAATPATCLSRRAPAPDRTEPEASVDESLVDAATTSSRSAGCDAPRTASTFTAACRTRQNGSASARERVGTSASPAIAASA